MLNEHYNKFWLIQEGSVDLKSKNVVNLFDMGAVEFEVKSLDYSYIRIFKNYSKYKVYSTEIKNPQHRELLLYCNEDNQERIKQLIKEYIQKPYFLKSFCHLQFVPLEKNNDSNFWWCIDTHDNLGDWMLFFDIHALLILTAVRGEYLEKWVPLSDDQKDKLYKIAIK